ncbi:hypothetical protein CP532_1590 [Ophiocordyceps camponoti-leonardi (nom. inval.)]|nr:hypothetical protein CP532_1590 [Ophiocordyceps camponoti-leonardi (nom. inval.)]
MADVTPHLRFAHMIEPHTNNSQSSALALEPLYAIVSTSRGEDCSPRPVSPFVHPSRPRSPIPNALCFFHGPSAPSWVEIVRASPGSCGWWWW